jgi:hypothetical protein
VYETLYAPLKFQLYALFRKAAEAGKLWALKTNVLDYAALISISLSEYLTEVRSST